MEFSGAVGLVARIMEAAGVLTMLAGGLIAVGRTAFRKQGGKPAYRQFRESLGRAILLGLEFLIAADIIRTVSEVPSLQKVIVLAIIVLIRTFLSFTLALELEGKWPWQRGGPREQVRGAQSE
jgi:uncharacterized membrane protein